MEEKLFSQTQYKQFADAMALKVVRDVVAKIKAADPNELGTFKVVVSTNAMDRQGEVVDQNLLDFTNYMKNPVVLWSHDYYNPPIGLCTKIYKEGNQTIAEGVFAPTDFAQQIRKLYDAGYINAVSIGFMMNAIANNDAVGGEVLEFSFCDIPANAEALAIRTLKKYHVDLNILAMKGIQLNIAHKGAVPYADHGTAPKDTAWDAGKEVKEAGEDIKKLKAMCAWFDPENPDIKSSYKFPHHEADSLKAVWKGVTAAMAALNGARGGAKIDDREGVYNHLKKHYEEFGEEAPELKAVTGDEQEGDPCQMDDGTEGRLSPDSDGDLVCVPNEEKNKKSADNEEDDNNDDTNPDKDELDQQLRDDLKSEHDLHREVAKAILTKSMKAIEEFGKKSAGEGGLDEFRTKAIEEFKKCIKGIENEHDRHEEAVQDSIDEYTEKIETVNPDDGTDKSLKSGAEFSARNKEKLRAMHKSLKSMSNEMDGHCTAIREMLKGDTEGGEDSKAIELSEQRSNPAKQTKQTTIEDVLSLRNALRIVSTNVNLSLREFNKFESRR